MKVKIAWIGKTKEPAIDSLANEYVKRISRFADVEAQGLRDETALLKLARGQRLVLLESKGKQLTSEEFAGLLRGHQETSSNILLFAIGAADGFTPKARESSSAILSLGKITMPHELARVVLIEQIYRAFTILNRHPYHLGH